MFSILASYLLPHAHYSASAAHAVGVDNNQVKHQLKDCCCTIAAAIYICTFEEVKANV